MSIVDLHVHSTASDGTLTPSGIVRTAKAIGLSAIALTDHDTVSGIDEAIQEGNIRGVEVVSGIEFSTFYEDKDVHIVGLFIDHKNEAFLDSLNKIQESRTVRNERMLAKLNENGYNISASDLVLETKNASITRAHFAQALVRKKYASNNTEVFTKILGRGCPCYVPREKFSPQTAISLIKAAGGVSVLAHPMIYGLSNLELTKLVEYLKDIGLDALEAIYSLNSTVDELISLNLASKFGLKISGGSDFHGKNKSNITLGLGRGNLNIPYGVLDNLRLTT